MGSARVAVERPLRVIPTYKPFLPPQALEHARKAIESGWISSQGRYVEEAAEALERRFGYPHVLLTSNGTTAMQLVALAAKALWPGQGRIIVPSNTYVAAWNPLVDTFGPDKLVAVDADLDTWNQRATECRDGDLLLAVHNVGNVVNVPKIRRDNPSLLIVEDNCEGLFGLHEGTPTGTASMCSAISFFANKTITSGEGGAFVTSSREVYDFAKQTANQGANPAQRYLHDRLGFNYRMTNIQAALLLGQLQIEADLRAKKKHVFDFYRLALPSERVKLQTAEQGTVPADWICGIRIVGSKGFDQASAFFAERGVDTRPMFYPISAHAHLKHVAYAEPLTNAETLHREGLMLPSYPDLTDDELEHVAKTVKSYSESL